MSPKKLYALTRSDFGLVAYVEPSGHVRELPSGSIPMLSWPDGRWCVPANIFMQELARRGLSRREGGSTLLTYAANLSHFIRFCFNNKVDFHSLRDSQFSMFIRTLAGERKNSQDDLRVRTPNSTIAIGRLCLAFLSSLSTLYGRQLVGEHGQIRAEIREARIILASGKHRTIRYWHHNSFPPASPLKTRLPVSRLAINALRNAVAKCSAASRSPYLKKRRYMMLKLLEILGARRVEIALLTVGSVEGAATMTRPMLEVTTVKGRAGGTDVMRMIPIARHDVKLLLEFIKFNRKPLISDLKKAGTIDKDCGILLLSETSGLGLRPNTITQEISALSRVAEIPERVCAHMFRHRYVTKLFIALIQQHEFDNVESLRSALVSTEDFKRQVLEWTGHKSLQSLEPYLHLAFDELSGARKAVDLALLRNALDSFDASADFIEFELEEGIDPKVQLERTRELVRALRKDLDMTNYFAQNESS
ncbi:hypothetical protein [Polaromonas sp.]|uniref:hypothetical protein n=1 Tax=Polaromonas sp. TaxID=1869339 RepID=UPI00272EEDE0|nr:hypothetical protein [Polaromonas sp.]MDP1740984.1 hypothetical protein [Polaromonas sp.]